MNRFSFEEGGQDTPAADILRDRKRFRMYLIGAGVAVILIPAALSIGYYWYTHRARPPESLLDQKIQGVDLEGIKDKFYIPEDPVSIPLKKAIELYRTNYRDQAKRQFENFLISGAPDKEKSVALVYLGIMAMEAERYSLAKHHLIRAMKYDEKSVPALVNLSITERKMGNLSEAKQNAERARELAPKDPRVSMLLGNLMADSQDLSGAIDTYREGIKQNPDDPTLAYNLAVSLLRKQNYEEAILYFSKVIESAAGGELASRSHAQVGQIYYNRGNLEMAADHMNKAVRMAPENGKYLYNLGIVYLRMKKPADAATMFERALDASSGDAAVFRGLSSAFIELGQHAMAIRALKKGLHLNPDDLASLFALGDLYLEEKDLLNAAETYKKIINITPGDTNTEEALVKLGTAYTDLERYNDAQDAFQRAVNLNPSSVKANYALGVLYRRAGRMELAVQAWKKALKPSGENRNTGLARDEERTVRFALADLYRKNGAHDLALSEYRLVQGRNRESPSIEEDPGLDLEIGRTYLSLKNYGQAIDSYKRVRDSRNGSPVERKEAHRGLAMAYANSGRVEDMDQARSEIAQAARLDPDDTDTQLLRAGMLLKTGSVVDREKAIEVLTALTASDLDSEKASQAYNLLGLAYHKNGEYQRALRAFDSSIQLNPQNREPYENQRAAANAYENSR